MKTFAKITLVGAIMLQSVATTFAMPNSLVPLSDINGHQYQAAIEYLHIKNVISGYDDGTFKPNNTINRAELLKILVGGAGYAKPDAAKYRDCFPDVKNDWYASYVCFAKEKGWVNGYDDGKFRPSQAINKVEAMKMLMSAQGFPPALNVSSKTSAYVDINLGQWYGQYLFVAEAMKILDIAGNKYYPAAFITRGEISNNMYRAMLILDQKVGSFDQVDVNKAFESVNPSAPTVQVTGQTYKSITLAVKLPTYTGNSALNSIFSDFTDPNTGMGESGSLNIQANNIGTTWTRTYYVSPKADATTTPTYTFTFWVDNKNGLASEKATIQVSGLSASPERPTVSATLITKNSAEFKVNPPTYTGSSALAKYGYSIDSSSNPQETLTSGEYSKDYFEKTLSSKFTPGGLSPNTTYALSFWIVNADGKQSEKSTLTIKTSAS